MQYIGYLGFIFFNRLISILPFHVVYAFSNFAAWMFDKVFSYRKDVILKNLQFALPELSDAEYSKLLRPIYRNFSDIILESFKSSFTSPKKINDRHKFVSNPEFDSVENTQNGIVVYAAHYANWEWATMTIQQQTQFQVIGLIKPLKNKYIDNFIAKNRSENGTMLVDIYGPKDAIYGKYDRPSSIVYIADQNPSNKEKAHKVKFFGQDTLALHGAATYSRKFPERPVWFYSIERIGRGRYTVTPIKLADANESELGAQELTQRYFNILEEQIRKNPSDWLWTHKRWKAQISY